MYWQGLVMYLTSMGSLGSLTFSDTAFAVPNMVYWYRPCTTGTGTGLISRVKESAGTVQSIIQSKVDLSRPHLLHTDNGETGQALWYSS